ncbi:hypothetical protein LR48_Vigan03g060500 [Vigna angularis]|uniref:Uncharacterized protein n=1 Tax=Phaseolus angularis TaxID=3914 RepID=A0A0L9U490_PHAAN|nr:hypothetical protein LR48_Vigan03g060500 [Vigna angularis]
MHYRPLGHVTDLSVGVSLTGPHRPAWRTRRERILQPGLEDERARFALPSVSSPQQRGAPQKNVNFHRSSLCTRLHQPNNSVSTVRPRILTRSVKTIRLRDLVSPTIRLPRLARPVVRPQLLWVSIRSNAFGLQGPHPSGLLGFRRSQMFSLGSPSASRPNEIYRLALDHLDTQHSALRHQVLG